MKLNKQKLEELNKTASLIREYQSKCDEMFTSMTENIKATSELEIDIIFDFIYNYSNEYISFEEYLNHLEWSNQYFEF